MKTIAREKGDSLWDQWWDEMQEEWFKVEVLQDYTGEDDSESLRLWKEGKKDEGLVLIKNQGISKEWTEALKSKSHVKLFRIHVVEYPLTPYIEWEVEIYKNQNIPSGEQVFLVSKNKTNNLDLPNGDFVIFDEKRVIKNTYNETGKCITYDFYDKTDDISKFLSLRSELLKLASKIEL